ncbi:MAG: SRPBCC family protein [Bacteroidota bacterium]|nr:SRPBCC family protein [Bacteroidota bacterium]
MNILMTILLVLAGIIVLLLLIALLSKKDFSIEKQITIHKPKQQVFDYLKIIRNQERYSVWVMKDPHIKIVYTGTDGTVGFKSAWESDNKNVGIGEQEIIKMTGGESMEVEIRFKKPFEGVSYALTTVASSGEAQTIVTNRYYGKTRFPVNIMHFMMDKFLSKDMQTNLENLKNNLEK